MRLSDTTGPNRTTSIRAQEVTRSRNPVRAASSLSAPGLAHNASIASAWASASAVKRS